jgi:cytochrome c551/c552
MMWLSFLLSALAAAASPQAPTSTIDFRVKVQPILRERCVGCHGPDQQLSGLRLDRRADAMRGGSQTVIGPGNAEGSKLYQRLVGARFGLQMPPTGALSDEDVETIRQWIDEGAEWPDDVSGETPVPVLDAATTALMTAALYGDAMQVERSLEAGADPNGAQRGGVTPLMLAAPDRDKMRRLLDAGADANARSDEGRSVITVVSGISGAAPAVRLLLEYGADPSPWAQQEVSAFREAVRIDDADTFATLMAHGANPRERGLSSTYVRTNCPKCAALIGAGGPLPRVPPEEMPGGSVSRFYDPLKTAHPTPVGPTPATPDAIQAAVQRSLPLLQQGDVEFITHTGCVSCHHNSLVAMAVSTARAHGFVVNDEIANSQLGVIGTYLESWRSRALQNIPIAGAQDTMSYLLFGLAAEHYAPDAATDAQAIWLKRRQSRDGHWPVQTIRPPIESNDIEVTAASMRALQVFAPKPLRAEYAAAVDRARAWLTKAQAHSTEERAFKLLGLSWSAAPPAVITTAARALLATQRADGGWTQTDASASTDAYATGEALVALRESGAVDARNAAYRKGLEFLLRTQIDDGTWFVETGAVPIQPGFASGFPYGVHQWISTAATAWATTALALSR